MLISDVCSKQNVLKVTVLSDQAYVSQIREFFKLNKIRSYF